MSKYIIRCTTSLAFALMLVAGACGKNDNQAAQDTTLNQDLALANQDTGAKPALTDVPANGAATAPAPAARAPAPRAPARTSTRTTTSSGNTITRGTGAASNVGTIAAGTTLNLSSGTRVCTNTFKVGDHFTATVREAVTGSNGATIPAGASANVEVTELKRSENANDKVVMGFRVTSISFGGHTYSVSATTSYAQIDKVRSEPKSKDVQKVATGAAIGAIAGQILGKNTKSTVIGAAGGAAAGAVTAAVTANYEGCVPAGGRITVTLNSGVQVNT